MNNEFQNPVHDIQSNVGEQHLYSSNTEYYEMQKIISCDFCVSAMFLDAPIFVTSGIGSYKDFSCIFHAYFPSVCKSQISLKTLFVCASAMTFKVLHNIKKLSSVLSDIGFALNAVKTNMSLVISNLQGKDL